MNIHIEFKGDKNSFNKMFFDRFIANITKIYYSREITECLYGIPASGLIEVYIGRERHIRVVDNTNILDCFTIAKNLFPQERDDIVVKMNLRAFYKEKYRTTYYAYLR